MQKVDTLLNNVNETTRNICLQKLKNFNRVISETSPFIANIRTFKMESDNLLIVGDYYKVIPFFFASPNICSEGDLDPVEFFPCRDRVPYTKKFDCG